MFGRINPVRSGTTKQPLLLWLIAIALSCAVEDEEMPDLGAVGPSCSDDSDCGFSGGACRGNVCVTGGIYGDCMNNAAGCGASDLAECLVLSTTFTSGSGVCGKECDDEDDCWWALPDPSYVASCTFLEGHGGNYCVIQCIDGGCPVDMVCRGGICAFDADGCGPTASPAGDGTCACDPGKDWCTSDPQDLACCGIPGSGGGSGDGGSGCCRTCTTGKACGDGCIAIELNCQQPPGCAC